MNPYLYIGGEEAIDKKNIIGIFDLDNTSWAIDSKKYLRNAEKKGYIVNATEDLPKSFITCSDEKVILAQPNTAVLAKRWGDQT